MSLDLLTRHNTAVMFIDMQNSIARRDLFSETISQCRQLLDIARMNHLPVVFVHVKSYENTKRTMRGDADILISRPGASSVDPKQYDIIDDLAVRPEDHVVTKHVRGAFTGTEMDHLLRAMNIENVVIGGIATNIGVESTVRVGADLGYNFTVVEDACAALSAEAHETAIKYSLPFFAKIAKLNDLHFAAE
jgi:nicotinamidase-related amidase